MRRMWNIKELIKLIEDNTKPLTPESLKEILKGSDYISIDDGTGEQEGKIVAELDFTDMKEGVITFDDNTTKTYYLIEKVVSTKKTVKRK